MNDGQAVFWQAASKLSPAVRLILQSAPQKALSEAQEIRLIEGSSAQLRVNNRVVKLGGARLTKEELAECVITLCEGSVHSHQREMAQGYITLKGGHRAGLAATAVYDQSGNLSGLRSVTAIVLRIARRYEGTADQLISRAFSNGLCGLLIAGAPSSGKTTVLRDMARQLSSGAAGCERVAVVDERGELAGFCGGACVMSGYDKAEGMLLAVRNLSPQVVLCDELGGQAEVKAVQQVLNCGAAVITTVHAGDREQLYSRPAILQLIRSRAFGKIAFLSEYPHPCTVKEVCGCDEFLAKGDGRRAADRQLFYRRGVKLGTLP